MRRSGRWRRRATIKARGPGWVAYGPRGQKLPPDWKLPRRDPTPGPRGPSNWTERQRELEVAHRKDVRRGAEELLRTGSTRVLTYAGSLDARLVRFWNGTAVLDCEVRGNDGSNGRGFTRLDRRELKDDTASRLALNLLMGIENLDRSVSPERWGPVPAEPRRVRSPGGWRSPGGVRPGWDWLPPGGGVTRPDLVPAWVRVWYHTPFVDRYAHAWMWSRGGFEVIPPFHPPVRSTDKPML
jgi:hypothetical protein